MLHVVHGLVLFQLAILAFLLFVAPFLDLREMRLLQKLNESWRRVRLYRRVILGLWIAAAVCWLARGGAAGARIAHAAGDAAWLFGAPWRTLAWAAFLASYFGAALVPAAVCLAQPRRIPAYTRHLARLGFFLPHDDRERWWFGVVSLSAAVCEEWIFRGFVPGVLHRGAGLSLTSALLLSSFLFGWNHLYQGWRGVLQTSLAGLGFGLLALLTGGLLWPILLHALLDLQVLAIFRPATLPVTRAAAG